MAINKLSTNRVTDDSRAQCSELRPTEPHSEPRRETPMKTRGPQLTHQEFCAGADSGDHSSDLAHWFLSEKCNGG
jgi:hypothetical protein